MPHVVKLYVLDAAGDPVGTLVLDLTSLFQMYRNHMHEKLKQERENTPSPGGGGESSIPVSQHMEWFEDEDGQLHLRPRPQQ